MAEQTIPEYETIRAAVAGETWAVEKVLMCYKDEIDRQATVKKRQPDGTFKLEIDEDMRQYITMKLIESLPDIEAVFITEDYQLHPSSGLSGKLFEATS